VGKRTKSEQGEPTVPVNPTQLISEDAGKLLDPAVRKTLQDAIDAVKKDAKQSRHWGELGMLLLAHDLFEPSAKAFAMAELLDAQEARWPYFRAMALRTIDPETAIEHFRNAAMRYGADRPEPRLRLAELLLADEQLLETKGVLDDLLASHPNHVGVGMALAQWHLLADQPRECLDGLRRAGVDQRPTRKMLLMAAEAYRRLNAMEAAERQRELALKTRDSAWHDPIYAEVLAMRVGLRTRLEQTDALYIQNRIDESVRSADETVQAYPDSEWARILLARGLIRQRQLARAKQVLEETLISGWPWHSSWRGIISRPVRGLKRQLPCSRRVRWRIRIWHPADLHSTMRRARSSI
jgi:tetratricopeptide (TPR) repeat protein